MTALREAAQQALEALDVAASCIDGYYVPRGKTTLPEIEEAQKALRAALAQQAEPEPLHEQDIEDAIEAAYWHFDARKKGLNEWASAPQSERDAFKAEARKLAKGYFPTQQAQDTKREMLAVADAFIRGKRAALAQQAEPVAGAVLGPLPEPAQPAQSAGYMPGCPIEIPETPDYYTAEQMREYAMLAQQAEPLINQCGETCARAKLCAVCARGLAEPAQEPVAWRNAALRVGKDLCSVGPFGYYDMTAQQWLDWALSVVTVHNPQPAQEPVAWVSPNALAWELYQSEKVLKVTRTRQDEYGFTEQLFTAPAPAADGRRDLPRHRALRRERARGHQNHPRR